MLFYPGPRSIYIYLLSDNINYILANFVIFIDNVLFLYTILDCRLNAQISMNLASSDAQLTVSITAEAQDGTRSIREKVTPRV